LRRNSNSEDNTGEKLRRNEGIEKNSILKENKIITKEIMIAKKKTKQREQILVSFMP